MTHNCERERPDETIASPPVVMVGWSHIALNAEIIGEHLPFRIRAMTVLAGTA